MRTLAAELPTAVRASLTSVKFSTLSGSTWSNHASMVSVPWPAASITCVITLRMT